MKRDYETAARVRCAAPRGRARLSRHLMARPQSVEFDPVEGPQWTVANPSNVVGQSAAALDAARRSWVAPAVSPPPPPPDPRVARPPDRGRCCGPDGTCFPSASLFSALAGGGIASLTAPPRPQVCVISAFDMDHIRADLGQRDLEALLSAQAQPSDAATVTRSQCSSPFGRDETRGDTGREPHGLPASSADSHMGRPVSPASAPLPSGVPTKARIRQHNRLSDATARQAAFLGLARELDAECEAWLAQPESAAGAASHPQVLASGAMANPEASSTGGDGAGALAEGAAVWAGPDLWEASSSSSPTSRDSVVREGPWSGPGPEPQSYGSPLGAAATAAARRFGGMSWLYSPPLTAHDMAPGVSGSSGAATAGDGGASVAATAGSADHSDMASLGWESHRAEEPHWVPAVRGVGGGPARVLFFTHARGGPVTAPSYLHPGLPSEPQPP